MEIKEIKTYKYDELSDEAKEKAREWFRGRYIDDCHWWEQVYENWIIDLEEMGFIEPDIRFSGFSLQGDGASFTCDDIDLEKWLKYNKLSNKYRLIFVNVEECSGEIKRDAPYRYVHELSTSVYLQMDSYLDDIKKEKRIEIQLDEVEKLIKENVIEVSKKIYKELEKKWDYLNSDEQVVEGIKSGEYDFTKDGEDI